MTSCFVGVLDDSCLMSCVILPSGFPVASDSTARGSANFIALRVRCVIPVVNVNQGIEANDYCKKKS